MREKQAKFLERKAKILEMGGTKAVEKQHKLGKLTARERLDLLFDPGTFVERHMFVEHRCHDYGMAEKKIPADGLITGFGKVNGRLTYAFAQDFTAQGGSLGEMHSRKMIHVQEEASRVGAPIVALEDGSGGRIQEARFRGVFTGVFGQNVKASGRIPQVAAIMGPCAGGSAYSPALMDLIINVDKTSKMFITGPKVIKEVTGESVDEGYYGSAEMHSKVSGVCHRMAVDDRDCIEQIKTYLSYFPQNYREKPPVYPCDQDPDQLIYELDEVVPEDPRKVYDVHKVIELIFDRDSLFEIQPMWAKNMVTTLARLNGHSVGVIASNPMYFAGAIDVDASDKTCHFINVCDAFNIPLIYLADTPGYLPGTKQEYGGIIRHGAKILFANAQATVPKIRLTIRKLYGGGTAAMCDNGLGPDYTISWPTAEEASMGAPGAVAILFAKEIAAAEDPEAMRQQKIQEYEYLFNNPYAKARHMYTDMIIEPNETRRVLIRILEALENKEEYLPDKKHPIFPV